VSARTAPAAPPLDDLAGPALRAFFRIAAAWGLKNSEARRLLGHPHEATCYK